MAEIAPALFSRRTLLASALASAPALAATVAWSSDSPAFDAIEARCGGKLGVFVLDTASGRTLAHRADQRFPFCSSFKAPLAAFVLSKADRGALRLDQPVRYTTADLLGYAPVTRAHVAEGAMSVEALCAAAVMYSDNTAANVLLREVGGPAALTAWMRSIGDGAFELAHNEPQLNDSRFGDAADTTTPRAMGETFQRLLFGQVLSAPSRRRLTDWLIANTTGGKRIRAGAPKGWRVGDKTGTEGQGAFSTIDIAAIWPPRRPPLIVAGFVTDVASTAVAETALAEVGRQVAAWIEAHG